MFPGSARPWLPLLLGAALLWAKPSRADSADESPDTFAYTTPTEKNYLRAVLELEALTTVSVIWYVIDVRRGGDIGYRWQIFERKLSGGALALDDNAFGTNFHGHGVGGNAYYLSARGNHLGIAESFGYAVAGALLWEYFGEVTEVVSVNDVIVTPLSGITIGEPFTQLGAYFDRQAPTTLNRVLGSVFGPIKSVNDALDGVTLSRASSPDAEWHAFAVSVGSTSTREEVSNPTRSVKYTNDLRIELSERLARLRGYDGSVNRAEGFDDGNLSNISLRLGFGPRGFKDLAFASNVVPFGYFHRLSRRTADGVYGSGFVVGLELGYRYLLHDYGGEPQSSIDRAAFVQPLGAMFEYRAALGSFSLSSKLDAAAAFGGVHPFALDALGIGRADLTTVVRKQGYYFGAGAQLEASLTLRWGRFAVDASFLGRRFKCVDPQVTVPLYDSWERLGASLGYRIRPTWTVSLFSDDTFRKGRLGSASSSARETAVGLEARANF